MQAVAPDPIVSTYSCDEASQARRAAMAVLAAATAAELANGLRSGGLGLGFSELRPVEAGLIMLRGRIGGDGAPFNIGEATVTRSAVRIPSGEIGFAYVLGRDAEKARLAAVCDALWQNSGCRAEVERHIIDPIRKRIDQARSLAREQTAATRVDFFTLVRGED